MRRLLLFALFSCLAMGAAACRSPCRQLAEKLCDCSVNSLEKDACLRRASSEEARVEPTEAEQDVCEGLLDGCDCHAIDTREGKRACGLSRE